VGQLGRRAIAKVGTLLRAEPVDATALAVGAHDRAPFGHRERTRFLRIDVLAGLGGVEGESVSVVARGENHGAGLATIER
jgi:hypothetical protein